MDKKTVRRRLWDSLEMHHYRVTILMMTLLFCIVFFPFLGRSAPGSIMALLVFLPIIVFHIFRIILIFRKPEEYIFRKVTLKQPHSGDMRGTFYFTIPLETEERGWFTADTDSIFMGHGLQGPHLEDYVNREVLVGYNCATGRIVVIG